MSDHVINIPTDNFKVYEIIQPTLPSPKSIVQVNLEPNRLVIEKDGVTKVDITRKVIDPTAPNFCRPEVQAFAQLMEIQLRANDYKGGWKDTKTSTLLRYAQKKMLQVYDSILAEDAKIDALDIVYKCVDVANYMMMVADTERSKYDSQGICELPNKDR